MRKQVAEYFDMSRSERIGTVVLLFLSLVFLALPEILRPYWTHKMEPDPEFEAWAARQKALEESKKAQTFEEVELFQFDPNTADFEDFVALGLSDRLANQILNYREKGGHFRKPEDFSKIYNLSKADFERLRPFVFIAKDAENQARTRGDGASHATVAALFSFDPNEASENDFLRLGLPLRTARSIMNYREKGGIFKKKSDFSKIYTLSAADFERLEPFIELPESVEKKDFSGDSRSAFSQNMKPQASGISEKWPSKKAPQKIDANAATIEDWKNLPGIGDFFAQKIVRYREALGGFSSLDQVAETRNLPDSVFQKARPFLILGQPVFRKIRLNSASVEEFSKHPMLDRRAAEALVAYRQQHGAFKKIEDLSGVRAISPVLLKKMEPYLGLE